MVHMQYSCTVKIRTTQGSRGLSLHGRLLVKSAILVLILGICIFVNYEAVPDMIELAMSTSKRCGLLDVKEKVTRKQR